MEMRKRIKDECGVSLIEMMIAVTLLGIGLMTIGVAQLSALKMSAKSKHLSQAMYLAEEQLGLFESLPTGHTSIATDGTFNDPNGLIYPNNGSNDQTSYARRWIIATNTPQPGLTTITVEVDWTGVIGGASPTVQTVQLIGVKGL